MLLLRQQISIRVRFKRQIAHVLLLRHRHLNILLIPAALAPAILREHVKLIRFYLFLGEGGDFVARGGGGTGEGRGVALGGGGAGHVV